jgi:ABC-type polysaccharide transport system permease subunit
MIKICAPALIYIIFSLTHIIIDTFKGLYNTAFMKFVVCILITILLDALCKSGMGIIVWIIVFIPFIFMTVIVTVLLYAFGLDTSTGQLNVSCVKKNPYTLYNDSDVICKNQYTSLNGIFYNNPNKRPTNYSSDPSYQS